MQYKKYLIELLNHPPGRHPAAGAGMQPIFAVKRTFANE